VLTSDAAGQAKFLLQLQRVRAGQSCHICLDETGLYGRALASFLQEAVYNVSLVNAALIAHHGRSLNLRTKNDPVDARLIAVYTLERVPPRFTPLPPRHQELRDASRWRQQLMRMILKEKNHLETTSSKTLGENIAATVSLLEGRLAQIEALIEPLIAEDARLSRNRELLMSIPGIGKTIATRLLAELPAIDSFASVRQMCAYAARASERHVGQRPQPHVQTRRSGLRELLFMPA
jgi:transposase